MQTLEYRVFCEQGGKVTYHEIRCRSDDQFNGRVLVCQDRGERLFQPLGFGTECKDC
jgi:hypothetical protein